MKRQSDKRAAMTPWKLEQRRLVGDRSGGQCEFEVLYQNVTLGETHIRPAFGPIERIIERAGADAWARCSAMRELVCAHVYRRHKNGVLETAEGFPLMFHPDAVVAGCPACHKTFDDRIHHDVRVPAERVAAARLIIETTLAAYRENGKAAIGVDLSASFRLGSGAVLEQLPHVAREQDAADLEDGGIEPF